LYAAARLFSLYIVLFIFVAYARAQNGRRTVLRAAAKNDLYDCAGCARLNLF
jgi:hypothetical protein